MAELDAAEFTIEEIQALKALAAREIGQQRGIQMTGELVLFNFRIDPGLRDALKKRAKAEKVSMTEAATQAFFQWLGQR